MGLVSLVLAVGRELVAAALGRGNNTSISPKTHGKTVGVIPSQLTQLQARCLLAACVFGGIVTAVALPSILLFGLLLVPLWCMAEAAFFAYWCILYRRLNAQPAVHRPPPNVNPRDVFDRFTRGQPTLSRYINILEMLTTWHWDVPASELTRGNVADLLCYGFFYRSQEQLAAEGQGHLPEQLVSELEASWGVKFREGPYVKRPIMAHLWEPVRCFYRPLFFYAGVELLIALKHVMLLAAGFQGHVHQGLRYYTYRLPPAGATGAAAQSAAPRTPVLFLHGVGLGVLPYLNFLLRLSSLDRPVIAVEVRHLSMRVCWDVPEEDEVVAGIAGALARHNVRRAHVVAHSYGTFMASRLVQLHKPLVASMTLLDPVCFVMFSGKLIYNFVYRNPLRGASALTWFIARDLAHSVSVSRRFYWSLLNLWPDQMPRHVLVALSAQDELVPVPEVRTMLAAERPDVEVVEHPGHRHADFIKDLPEQARMVHKVAMMADRADAEQEEEEEAAAAANDGTHQHHHSHGQAQQKQQGGAVRRPLLSASKARSHVRSDSASSYEEEARRLSGSASGLGVAS